MTSENSFEIVKNAIEDAKNKKARYEGELISETRKMAEFGFKNDDIDELIKATEDFLDEKEPELDKMEDEIEKKKKEIIEKYNKIIIETIPGEME